MWGIYARKLTVSSLTGMAVVLTGAALNVSHLIESGLPLVSVTSLSVVVLAVASAVAVPSAVQAWRDGHKGVALIIGLAIAAGEIYGLVSGIERQLSVREERQLAAAGENTERTSAESTLARAQAALDKAEEAVLAEAGDGGCGKTCKGLKQVEQEKRELRDAAQAIVDKLPPMRSEHLLADVTGLPATFVEIVPSALYGFGLTLLGFGLMAMGHKRHEPAVAVIAAPVAAPAERAALQRLIKVLEELGGEAPSVSSLEGPMGSPKGSISRLADEAERRGLIETIDDGRRRRLRLVA